MFIQVVGQHIILAVVFVTRENVGVVGLQNVKQSLTVADDLVIRLLAPLLMTRLT